MEHHIEPQKLKTPDILYATEKILVLFLLLLLLLYLPLLWKSRAGGTLQLILTAYTIRRDEQLLLPWVGVHRFAFIYFTERIRNNVDKYELEWYSTAYLFRFPSMSNEYFWCILFGKYLLFATSSFGATASKVFATTSAIGTHNFAIGILYSFMKNGSMTSTIGILYNFMKNGNRKSTRSLPAEQDAEEDDHEEEEEDLFLS